MDSYNQLNEVLVHLFNHTMKIEEQSLIREEFKDISMNDMHIMDAIGIDQPTGGWFLYRWMRRERKLIGVMRSSIWK